MANRRNAIKKIRADESRQSKNKMIRSELKTKIRKFLSLCSEKQADKAKESSRSLFSALDRAVKKGVLKENTANRKKSRLSRRLSLIKG